MSKQVEEIIQKINANREIFSTLPRNNKKNINIYIDKVAGLKEEFKEYQELILKEIEIRYNAINSISINPEIAALEQEVEKVRSILYLLNDVNTSFEKMDFDEHIYDLRYYYKKNLEVISNSIIYCIKKFKEVGIDLKLKDFYYSKYVREYLGIFFEELSKPAIDYTRIKNKFEEIYWECSNIITYIELNIRSLYFENQKTVDKYYVEKQKALLGNVTKADIFNRYMETKKQLIEKKVMDKAIIIHDFLDGKLVTKDFSEQAIDDRYAKFISKEVLENVDESKSYEIDLNLNQLQNSIYEYKCYLSYKFIIDDVKKIYQEKEQHKNTFLQMKKTIVVEEKKVEKLNSKIKEKSKKSNDKLIGEQDALILKVKEMYRDLEKNKVYYQIVTQLEDSSTVNDCLRLASSFYNYVSDCMRTINKEVTEQEIETTITDLREFILWPHTTILNNINIMEDKDILVIIKDRYKMLDIEISPEDLEIDNIDSLIAIVKNIEIGNSIKKNKIDVEEIKYICEFKKILENK